MEGRFGDIVLTARYFYVTALVHLTKDFDDLIYSVSFLFHVSGRVLARQSLIFNGPVCGGQVIFVDSGIAGSPIQRVFSVSIPYVVAIAFVLLVVTFLPGTFLWLPRLFGF